MSKLNINKNEWLELVFEGKNKEYGAYQLRKEEGATTTKAFISAMALLGGIAALPFILSSFTDKPPMDTPDGPILDSIRVIDVVYPEKKLQPLKKVLPPSAPAEKSPTEDLTNPRVVDAEVAPQTDFTRNEDLGQNTNTTTDSGSGTPGQDSTIPTGGGNVEDPIDDTTPFNPYAVEKSPNFPGGIDEFLKIVGNRFNAPEAEEEGIIKRVIVFFVVEKDGSLSNITVPKNPGLGLDKEAIRVLKSIKTKWEPGMYKGRPVRTQYSLPIVVKMQ